MKVHFLGIGGSGASAAAAIAETQGYEVTGCDLEPHNEFTTQFKPPQLFTGHNPKHLPCNLGGCKVDILAVTPAIFSLDPDNPELLAAKEKNIPIMTWQQFLGEYLAKDKFVIAICGTHGKTTTTAMVAKILEDAGLDPTVLLGAVVPEWRTNYRIGKSKPVLSEPVLSGVEVVEGYFVIEADEFNDNFLPTKPDLAVVTNIEMDHPEYFKDLTAVKKSFKKFLESTKQKIVANLSDPVVKQILSVHPRGVNTIIDYSKKLIDFPLQIPGEFNTINASAAFQIGLTLGIDPENIKKSLQNYKGVGRRFEYIGEYHGAKVYSDFGHHPTEIEKTMEAAREKFPNQRILLIYQPHMFSRTKALFDDFVRVFRELSARPAKLQRSKVDKIIITDIYPSREVDTGIISSQQLIQAINYNTLVYHSKEQLLQVLKKDVRKNDIVFFMGAGDIDKLAKSLTDSV